jgi:hypothetical protein
MQCRKASKPGRKFQARDSWSGPRELNPLNGLEGRSLTARPGPRVLMVERQGFEPRMSKTPDLQSSAVTHAARTPRCMASRTRFERATPGFVGQCSDPIELTREKRSK